MTPSRISKFRRIEQVDEGRGHRARQISIQLSTMKATVPILLLALAAATAQTQCTTDTDCPDDLKCVVQADGYYAQCVDCEEPTFDTQCAYWSEPILLAAEDACLLSCPTRCPTHSDDECDGALECVVQADGNWDLCVDCTQDAFYKACGAWSDAIKTAAEEKCGLACPYEGAGRAAARAVVA